MLNQKITHKFGKLTKIVTRSQYSHCTNIGKEELNKEYKLVNIDSSKLHLFLESNFDIFILEEIIYASLLNQIVNLLPKYIACFFNNKKETEPNKLFFGVNDNGLIFGFPIKYVNRLIKDINNIVYNLVDKLEIIRKIPTDDLLTIDETDINLLSQPDIKFTELDSFGKIYHNDGVIIKNKINEYLSTCVFNIHILDIDKNKCLDYDKKEFNDIITKINQLKLELNMFRTQIKIITSAFEMEKWNYNLNEIIIFYESFPDKNKICDEIMLKFNNLKIDFSKDDLIHLNENINYDYGDINNNHLRQVIYNYFKTYKIIPHVLKQNAIKDEIHELKTRMNFLKNEFRVVNNNIYYFKNNICLLECIFPNDTSDEFMIFKHNVWKLPKRVWRYDGDMVNNDPQCL